jgi:Uncharacterized protein conserved in bacteria (DUF2188)
MLRLMDTYHLTQMGGNWIVHRENRPDLLTFRTRGKAIKRCGQLIGDRVGVVKIHRADGSVVDVLRFPQSYTVAERTVASNN